MTGGWVQWAYTDKRVVVPIRVVIRAYKQTPPPNMAECPLFQSRVENIVKRGSQVGVREKMEGEFDQRVL